MFNFIFILFGIDKFYPRRQKSEKWRFNVALQFPHCSKSENQHFNVEELKYLMVWKYKIKQCKKQTPIVFLLPLYKPTRKTMQWRRVFQY